MTVGEVSVTAGATISTGDVRSVDADELVESIGTVAPLTSPASTVQR
jgi:hypothetical protein